MVAGLTTASTLWVVAGLGLVIGAGYYVPAVLLTALIMFTLVLFRKIEEAYLRKSLFHYHLTVRESRDRSCPGSASSASTTASSSRRLSLKKDRDAMRHQLLLLLASEEKEQEFNQGLLGLGEIEELKHRLRRSSSSPRPMPGRSGRSAAPWPGSRSRSSAWPRSCRRLRSGSGGGRSSRTPAARAVTTPGISGLLTLAEDSGLEVEALGGAPGVHSARFSRPDPTDERNNCARSSGSSATSRAKRRARFVCAMVLSRPDGVVAGDPRRGPGDHRLGPEGLERLRVRPYLLLSAAREAFRRAHARGQERGQPSRPGAREDDQGPAKDQDRTLEAPGSRPGTSASRSLSTPVIPGRPRCEPPLTRRGPACPHTNLFSTH